MKRLEKKCLLASASVHGLLLALLLVGPALLSSPNHSKVERLETLTFIPQRLIDEPISNPGGGAATPAMAPAVTHPEPRPSPPPAPSLAKPVEPVPPKRAEPKPSPKSRTKEPPLEMVAAKDPAKTKLPKTKHVIEPDLTPVKRGTETSAAEKAKATASAAAQAKAAQEAWKGQVTGTLQALRGNLSGSTSIETPGSGGEAYASYSQYVRKVYTDAWRTPDEVADEKATVTIKVTIARDGTVLAEQCSLAKRSGIAALDRAGREVLDRVPFVAPFPEGAKDSQRTFYINFNLKTKPFTG